MARGAQQPLGRLYRQTRVAEASKDGKVDADYPIASQLINERIRLNQYVGRCGVESIHQLAELSVAHPLG
jgi:hypothetical protein